MAISRRAALKVLAGAGTAVAVGPTPASAAGGGVEAPADTVGMLYDTTRCVGCRACTVGCREANGLQTSHAEPDTPWDASVDLNAHTKSIIKLCREEGSQDAFMKMQCMHCLEPACVGACMFGALHKEGGGVVVWNGDSCVGCRYCEIACPFNVPRFEFQEANPEIVKCELCQHRLVEGGIPACVEVCPRDAIIFGKRSDLLAEAHRRLEENPGTYQPKVYGETEGGGTQVLYLSHVPFEQLGLPALGDESLPHRVHRVQGLIYKGFIAPVALFGVLAAVIRRNVRREEEEAARQEVAE